MNIAVYNHKGGTGKSTISTHLGFYALENNINAVIIDKDKQRNAMKWLAGHNWDGSESFELGSIFVTSADIEIDNGWVIYDCPPSSDVIGETKNNIDVWIVPVDGRFSVEGAQAVVREIQDLPGNSEIYLIINKGINNDFGRKEQKEIRALGIKVFFTPLQQSNFFRQSEMYGIPVWKVAYSSRSTATTNLKLFCKWVFDGFNKKYLV